MCDGRVRKTLSAGHRQPTAVGVDGPDELPVQARPERAPRLDQSVGAVRQRRQPDHRGTEDLSRRTYLIGVGRRHEFDGWAAGHSSPPRTGRALRAPRFPDHASGPLPGISSMRTGRAAGCSGGTAASQLLGDEFRGPEPCSASACRRHRSPCLSGAGSGSRSGVFDAPARLGGADSQEITQQLRCVPVAGVGGETAALGLGDGRDHGRTQSTPAAFGFDEGAQQVDIGQVRPALCRSIRCQCSRMCVHAG